MNVVNAFTVDVEDYFQVTGFERHISRDQWPEFPCRVVGNTQRILEILQRHRVKATFFVLGWVAQRYPNLVREIDAAGHEIGSHSYWHRLVYDLTPRQFREDLCRSRDVLQDVLGRPVDRFRAPTFSITRRSLWALEILVEEGFRVDSSIVPARHDRYGIPTAYCGIHTIETPSGPITEFPLPVAPILRARLPVGGGGYFRLYPLSLLVRALRRINIREQRPFVFYIHPWELDPRQPRLRAGTLVARLRHRVNLRATEQRLHQLLSHFPFGTLSRVLDEARPVARLAWPLADAQTSVPRVA